MQSRKVSRLVERCLAIFGLFVIAYLVCLRVDRVCSESMQPTVCGTSWENGEVVLTEKISHWFFTPGRWGLITFRANDGTIVLKRVVAFAGEQIECRDKWLWINGEKLPRPEELANQRYVGAGKLCKGRIHTVCSGFFVLGDNSFDSDDSRFEPPVKHTAIIGRPVAVVWPLANMRLL